MHDLGTGSRGQRDGYGMILKGGQGRRKVGGQIRTCLSGGGYHAKNGVAPSKRGTQGEK